MASTSNDSLFLKEAHLSGYKSIHNVDIEFEKGLNIIIGKNAAGKTNFLKFLSKNLSLDYNEFNDFTSTLLFKNGKHISIQTSKNIEIEELFKASNLNSNINSKLSISGTEILNNNNKESTLSEKLKENDIIFDCTFLCHGVPKEYLIADKPFSFKTEKGKISYDLTNLFRDYTNPYFVRLIALDLVFALLVADEDNLEIEQLKIGLNTVFRETEALSFVLSKYSPIESIRFSENYNIFISDDKQNFTINNIFLEFKINNSWLPYSSLSDGTKRLFYIISEVYNIESIKNIRPSSNGSFYGISRISRIVLIEEPELGIHPHQFHKLMEFLREESEKKQIIITTHSPQALDSLQEDEFNRIIIAYTDNEKNGTKLRHLNADELLKAKAYIKDSFLSDYWLYSDLEK